MYFQIITTVLYMLRRLLVGVLSVVRLVTSALSAQVEAFTSPAKSTLPQWVLRAVALVVVSIIAIVGLLYGARSVTELDPSPWYPHDGPGGTLPPRHSSSSYLTSPFEPTTLRDGRRLHHITVATHGEEGLARLIRTASWHGNSVKVLGVGDLRLQQWGVGFGVKVECFLEYARSIPANDLILFTDAFDVVMWGGHEEVVAGYDKAMAAAAKVKDESGTVRAPPRLLISAETLPTTWNGIEYGKQFPPHDVSSGQHFPYLNSGTFMGPAGDIIRFLSAREMDMNDNDQAFFSAMYIQSVTNGSMPRAALDHHNDVFLTLTAAPPLREKAESHLRYEPVARRWRHVATAGYPMVFHSPGWVRWKQIEEAWQLAQGRNCAGQKYRAADLQWPILPAMALDHSVAALVTGIVAGVLLPLLALALGRSAWPRKWAAARAQAASTPFVGPLASALFGGPGSVSTAAGILAVLTAAPLTSSSLGPMTAATVVSSSVGSGGAVAYAPVATSEAAANGNDE